MKPTPEQTQAVAKAAAGGNLKIVAYAGSGKTTTLRLVGEAMNGKRGLYVAFNREIVADVQSKFPRCVEARTFHSLAYREFGVPLKEKLGKRLTGQYVAEELRLTDISVEALDGGAKRVYASMLGYYLIQCVQAHCRSLDADVSERSLPLPDWKNMADGMGEYVRRDMLNHVRRLWQRMSSPTDTMPSSHDVYVKLWFDSSPKLRYDFILFDEAQDADPIMLNLIARQTCQKIWVGDPYQQIYSWRGAVNAMREIVATEAWLTQSFRFGEAIAERANLLLSYLGESRPLRGNQSVNSTVGAVEAPRAILHRTNAENIAALMDGIQEADGKMRIAATGTKDAISKIKAIGSLRAGGRAPGEFALFANFAELLEYSESDAGGDIKPYIEMQSQYAQNDLINMLENVSRTKTGDADVTYSVAHQAKGKEWSTVRLGDDFRPVPTALDRMRKEKRSEPDEEEHRLLYVAMTRGIDALDDTQVELDGYRQEIAKRHAGAEKAFATHAA